MKKVLATLVLILIASTVSAAEVKVGGWGRGFFVPYYSDGDTDAQSTDAASWGGSNPRVGISVTGSSDNVGFQADINTDGGSIGGGDQQKMWAKPMDMLTISIGRAYDDALRGNAGFGSYNWLRITDAGDDFIFNRISTHDGAYGKGGNGAIFALDPMKELHINFAFKSLGGEYGTLTTSDAMKNIQTGAGYTINGIGMVRAQYIGCFKPKVEDDPATADVDEAKAEEDASVINAAFKLTMVQNLYADLGLFYAMDDEISGYAMKIPVYVNYTMGAIGIHALFALATGQKDTEDKDATGMEAGLGLDYAIGDGLGAVVDFRYMNEAAAKVKDGRIGGMVGVEKGFSNGKVGAGFEYSTTTMQYSIEGAWAGGEPAKATDKPNMAIPVKIEYWF